MATNISKIKNQNRDLVDNRNSDTEAINNNIMTHKEPECIDCLVEGEGDLFYKKVYKKKISKRPNKNINFYAINQENPKYPVPKEFEDYFRGAIEDFVKNHNNKTTVTITGIIDRDFDNPNDITIPGKLECTDGNDLETTKILFDYDNIKSAVSSYVNDENIFDECIKLAATIGKVRYIIKKNRKQLSYKPLKKLEIKTNYFYDLFKNNTITTDYILSYLEIKPKSCLSSLKEQINNLQGADIFYCRGHDIFNLIGCYKKYLTSNTPSNCFYSDVYKNRRKSEDSILSYFTLDKFCSSRIFSFLQNIDSNNDKN